MRAWIALLGCICMLGCSAVEPRVLPGPEVFDDALFAPLPALPEADAALALTPVMQRYLAEAVTPHARRQGPRQALLAALATRGELLLEYDAVRTRSAGEAFDARRGNCLSLVLMTAALARELGLAVRFQEVLSTPVVERDGEFTFVIGHINLALGPRLGQGGVLHDAWLVVDFLPGQDLQRQTWRAIDERRVRAMFMNNRAAEELAQGRTHTAYAWLRGAQAQDPKFAPLYNTLGVLYRRHGALPQAERALQAALALDPQDAHVADNLAVLQRLSAAGQHHRLALDAAAAGDLAQARQELTQAMTASQGTEQQRRYAAKLAALQQQLAMPPAPQAK